VNVFLREVLSTIAVGTLCALLIVRCTSPAHAQDLPRQINLTWSANPAEDKVQWYTIEYRFKSSEIWLRLDDTSETTYAKDINQIGNGLQLGDEICFHIIAKNNEAQSQPSESACAVMVSREGGTVIDDVDPVELISKPATPTITWTY